ncbi:MAG TPA: DUF1684 domain-containing protein [Streptosporangiaceae bacterium]|jgi:hypothetical protein|nr:DUF1684 domain-containing protein [Streptosporangiaceae bacterium]
MTVQDLDRTAFEQDWADWHRRHEAVLGAEHGFLAITSLNWLTAEPQRFPDAPGAWHTGPDGVVVELADGETLSVGGTDVTGRYAFGAIPERGGINAVSGDDVIEVARRGGYDIVRPRHPGHQLRLSFAGTPAYQPDPRWAVPARYVAFPEPRDTTVGSVAEGLQHVYAAPGYVEFEIDGEQFRLTAFNGHAPGTLTILFTDATSGVTTYPANRALQLPPPDEDGAVTLDFNRAANLPCAYTEYATCPLPPAENRLPIAVEAGEKLPYEYGSPA